MYLLPIERETWVLPYQQDEVFKKLWKATLPVRPEVRIPNVPEHTFLFNGWVKLDQFKLSKKIPRANNFLPIMYGEIEKTSKGSIVFVRYQLFFATIVFLVFWSVVTVLFAIYFYVYEQIYLYSGISVAAGIANYAVTVLNFKKQVEQSSQQLREALY